MKKILLIILIINTMCFGFTSVSMASPTESEYDFAAPFSEGYALVGIWEGIWKYGYINRNGNIVIKFSFNYAEDFSEGVAVVGLGKDRNSMKYGYIRTDGSYASKPQFDKVYPIKNGFAKVGNYQGETLKWGIVDSEGKVIVKPIYDYVDLAVDIVLKGYATINTGDKRRIVNLKTGAITETKYNSVTVLDNFIRISSMVGGKEKYGVMFYDGKVIEPTYDWLHYYDGIDNVLCMVEANGKFGLLGFDGKHILEPKYDEIRHFNDGVSHVKLNKKYGYFDSDGTFLTKIEYDEITAFMKGISLVKKNGKWGIINIDGTYKAEPIYDQIFILENEIQVVEKGIKKLLDKDGSYKFSSGYEYMYPYSSIEGSSKVKKNDKEIIIDSSGKPIFNVDYDTIGDFENGVARITLKDKVGYLKRDGKYLVIPIYESTYKDVYKSYYHTKDKELWGLVLEDGTVIKPMSSGPIIFKDNMGIIRIDSKYTYIDKSGNLLTTKKFDQVNLFSDGMGRVMIDSKTSYVNNKGELMKSIFDWGYDFSDGYACVYDSGRNRFIGKDGKYAFGNEAKYFVAKPFSHGLAVVMGDNGKWGYINTKGEAEIEFKFSGTYDFDEKLAPVKLGDKFGFIDRTGKVVIEPVYDMMSDFENGVSNVWQNKKYGYITREGEYKTAVSQNENLEFADGVAAVKVNNSKENRYYWGYIKEDGSWFIEPQFDHATKFYNGIGIVFKDGKSGEVSKVGNITWK